MKFAIASIIAFILIVVSVAVYLQFANTGGGIGGNILRSENAGESWKFITQETPQSFLPNFDVVDIKAVYLEQGTLLFLATRNNGLYRSVDLGKSWQSVKDKSDQVKKGFVIFDLVVKDQRVYLAGSSGPFGKVLSSSIGDDLESLTFETIFITSSPQDRVISLGLSPSGEEIYLGTLTGGFIRSLDNGATWQALKWFKGKVKSFGQLYVVAEGRVFLTSDRGLTWEDLNLSRVAKIVLDARNTQRIFALTDKKVFFKTGLSRPWESLNLPTSQENVKVQALLLDPQDPRRFFVIVNKVFYRTQDQGMNWSLNGLPGRKPVAAVWINPAEPGVIILGLGREERQKSLFGF
jgi:photosystem II stability/assembly factor-like uncharacterized protein